MERPFGLFLIACCYWFEYKGPYPLEQRTMCQQESAILVGRFLSGDSVGDHILNMYRDSADSMESRPMFLESRTIT